MAHMVFKKPLQNQAIRDNYIKQRQELRYAKEMGFIDVQAYKDAKRNLLPDTASFDGMPVSPSVVSLVGPGSDRNFSPLIPKHSPPSEIRKGSILDRNNVARLVYKPDAQGEEDRGEQKELRKAQMQAERSSKSNSYHDSALNPSPSGQLFPGPYSMHLPTTTSDSSKSLKSSRNFNIFRKLSASRNPPPIPLPDNPSIVPLPKERDSTKPKRHSEFSDTSSRISGSSIIRRNTESHGGGGGGSAISPVTFADKFLFGSSPTTGSGGPSRRHSFSNLNERPSFTSSRSETDVAGSVNGGFIFESRPSSSEVGQHFPHSPQEPISPRSSQPQQLLPFTNTQEVFLSLLNEFANTSILFSYPKYGRDQHGSLSGSFLSVSCSAGNLHEDEEEVGKAIGGESFLIDEGAVTLEAILEKRAWFLMAMKWLSFGRVLFSPGHHIIELSGDVGVGVGRPEASILDLDGTVTADWSWQLAEEYPFATIFNVLLPHSPRPARNSTAPQNLQFLTTTTLSNLSTLQSNSIDVITSHNLTRLLLRDKRKSPGELHVMLIAILRECARVLKPSGYFEITAVDPVMSNMGPRTRAWIIDHVAPVNNMKPSNMILAALEQLSEKSKEVLFKEVNRCWAWMPTTSIGDELSTVTSMVGRHLYDELFAPAEGDYDGGLGVEVAHGLSGKRECKLWKDEKVIEECQNGDTAFRWLKCYARKV